MTAETEKERISHLREWGFDLGKFEAKTKQSLKDTRGDLSEVTGVLRQTLGSMKKSLLELQKNRGPVAAELKGGFEKAWDEIEQAFGRARQRIREGQKAAAPGPGDDWLG